MTDALLPYVMDDDDLEATESLEGRMYGLIEENRRLRSEVAWLKTQLAEAQAEASRGKESGKGEGGR